MHISTCSVCRLGWNTIWCRHIYNNNRTQSCNEVRFTTFAFKVFSPCSWHLMLLKGRIFLPLFTIFCALSMVILAYIYPQFFMLCLLLYSNQLHSLESNNAILLMLSFTLCFFISLITSKDVKLGQICLVLYYFLKTISWLKFWIRIAFILWHYIYLFIYFIHSSFCNYM